MCTKLSFTGLEKELISDYRKKLNNAEDVIDVMNSFSHTVNNLLQGAFENKVSISDDDIVFDPKEKNLYKVSPNLFNDEVYKDLISRSDLGNIIGKFADTANHKYIHLRKHNEKTNSKIKRTG